MFTKFDFTKTFLSSKQVAFVEKLILESSETEKEDVDYLLNHLLNISQYNLSNEYEEAYLKAVLISLDILMSENYLGFLNNDLFHCPTRDINYFIGEGEEINFNYLFRLINKIHYSILDDGFLQIVKIKINGKYFFGFLDHPFEDTNLTSMIKFKFVEQIKSVVKNLPVLKDKAMTIDEKSLKHTSLFLYALKSKRKFEFLNC